MKRSLILLMFGILVGCNSNLKSSYSGIDTSSGELAMAILQDPPGKKLMENNCYACHNPKVSEESMIAPPMIAIKLRYISEDTTKEDFVNDMLAWSKNPSKETSKMPEAIKEFGLMPYQFYPENTIKQIAEYVFDNEIDEPEWYGEH